MPEHVCVVCFFVTKHHELLDSSIALPCYIFHELLDPPCGGSICVLNTISNSCYAIVYSSYYVVLLYKIMVARRKCARSTERGIKMFSLPSKG